MTLKGTRPRSFQPEAAGNGRWGEPEPDLMGDVRRAMAAEHPIHLLALTSSLLAVVDPRRTTGFGAFERQEPAGPSRDELLGTFIDVDRPETSALLAVVEAFTRDEVERRRLRRILGGRGHTLPPWLEGLGAARAYRAVAQTHVLGDGDNLIVAVALPTGEELCAVVYIDHNLGTVVKDAFVVPEPIDALIAFLQSKNDDPDMAWADLDRADARVRISDAIDAGAITFPPFETDTWPVARPLVEWMIGRLPEGGRGYERPEWPKRARRDLAARFLASPHVPSPPDPDHRDLVEHLIWFGCEYGPGDPLRWSPVAVEILLGDWIPRKIVADVGFLAKAPTVLRAFVRFCDAQRQMRPALTTETLAAIDRWEPDYQATIRSPGPRGPAALLAAMGALDPDGPWAMPGLPSTYEDVVRDTLRRAVGGADALVALDDEPLPDEPFAWQGIPDDIRAPVADVLALVDRCCDEMLDAEYRTASRRFLARAATGDPAAFRRRARADTAAAAVCWIVGKANDLFRPTGGGRRVKDLTTYFGLPPSAASQRAHGLLLAAGMGGGYAYGQILLGSPDLLVSSRRRRIIQQRDRSSG